jgi:hypothetical protein
LPAADLELNYVEVNDVADALIEIASKISSLEDLKIYRISPSRSVKLSDLITLLESSVGRSLRKSKSISSRSHFDVAQTWMSGELIPSWTPKRRIEQDLDLLVANRRMMLDRSGNLL